MSGTEPPWVQRTEREKLEWSDRVKSKKGSTFPYSLSGWKDVNKNYETDKVEIMLEIDNEGGIGCLSCNNNNENGWFGRAKTKRGEHQVYKHICSHHKPNFIFIGGKGPVKNNMRSTNITSFFVRKKKDEGTTPTNGDTTAIITPTKPSNTASKDTSNDSTSSDVNEKTEVVLARMSDEVNGNSTLKNEESSRQLSTVDFRSSSHYHFFSDYFSKDEKDRPNLVQCMGINVDLPLPRERNYPFFIEDAVPAGLPFIFDLEVKNVRSKNCVRFCDEATIPPSCQECRALVDNTHLKSIVARSNDGNYHLSNTRNVFLTSHQTLLKLEHKNDLLNDLKLKALNNDRSLQVVWKRLEDYKLLQLSIARGNVPRLHQLMNRVMKEQRSVKACLEMMDKAHKGLYNPKGYDQKDYDIALLHKNLGSPRLVYANQRSRQVGGPCISSIKTNAYCPKYKGCASEIDEVIIKSNYEKFCFSDQMRSEVASSLKCLNTMMIDDIKGEKRLRVEESSTTVYGLCYHAYQNNISNEVNSMKDCEFIRDALEKGKAHYATEITNVAIGAIRETGYQPIVVATSAGCLDHDPIERVRRLLEISINIFVKDPRGEAKQGRLTTIQPDGASAFVQVCHSLFFKVQMRNDHPLYQHLSKLELFPMFSGEGIYKRMTLGCDMKHVFKRTRERIKSPTGIQLFNYKWTPEILCKLLRAFGKSQEEVKRMFAKGYADAMNVPAMVTLFESIAAMSREDASCFGDLQGQVRSMKKELALLGAYCDLIYKILIEKLPLETYVEIISTLAHINLVCFRHNGTKMLAAQNFSNQQRLYRSIFWSIANAKEDNIEEYYPFQDSGDRLEELYGLCRTCCGGAKGNGSGMDVLQCCERMSGTMQVAGVYARNPELAKASRHLKTTDDHQNPRSYLATGDLKEAQDRSRVQVNSVNLLNRYIQGRSAAEKILRDVGFTDDDLNWKQMKDEGVDFLRPEGSFVGLNEIEVDEDAEQSSSDDLIGEEDVLLEESIGGIPENSETLQEQNVQMKTFDCNGVQMSAAACLRRVLKKELRTETSRISRYMNNPKSGTAVTRDDIETEGNNLIRVSESPFATIAISKVNKDKCFTFCILATEEFTYCGEKVSELPTEKVEGKTRIGGKIVYVKVFNDQIIWDVEARSVDKLEVLAEYSTVINPDLLEQEEDGKLLFRLSLESAKTVFENLLNRFECLENKPILPDISRKAMNIPYRQEKKHVLYHKLPSDKIISSSKATGTEKREQNQIVKCALCNEEFNVTMIRHHVASHILHDTSLDEKLEPLSLTKDELCCMCGKARALPYSPSPDGGCALWQEMEKGKRSWKVNYICQNVSKHIFGVTSALKSNDGAPSTNIPIPCPICCEDSVVKDGNGRMVSTRRAHCYPKYNFKRHWENHHSDRNIEDFEGLEELIDVSDEEKKRLRGKKFATFLKTKRKCSKGNPPIVKAIKTHSGQLAANSSARSIGEGESMQNTSVLILKDLPEENRKKCVEILTHAKEKRIENSKWYEHDGHKISYRALATLDGSEYISDEILGLYICIINERNIRSIQTKKDSSKIFVVNSFFFDQRLGIGKPKDTTENLEPKRITGNFLGFPKDEVIFLQENIAHFKENKQTRAIAKWIQALHPDRETSSITLVEAFSKHLVDGVVFQVNITGHHYFTVFLDARKKQIVTYDSLAGNFLQDMNKDQTIPKRPIVLDEIKGKTLDQLEVTLITSLCTEMGIKTAGNLTDMLQNIMRPLVSQQVLCVLQDENERTDNDGKLDLQEWTLILSSKLPQQGSGNNCALYTAAVSDILSTEGSIDAIKDHVRKLEPDGRLKMASICCIEYGKEKNGGEV